MAEKITFKVGDQLVELTSNAVKQGGALKHLVNDILGKSPTAGQTTLAELAVLEEAEAAVTAAIDEGLVGVANGNAFFREVFPRSTQKLKSVIASTEKYDWEIKGEMVLRDGKKVLRIFHMQPKS